MYVPIYSNHGYPGMREFLAGWFLILFLHNNYIINKIKKTDGTERSNVLVDGVRKNSQAFITKQNGIIKCTDKSGICCTTDGKDHQDEKETQSGTGNVCPRSVMKDM